MTSQRSLVPLGPAYSPWGLIQLKQVLISYLGTSGCPPPHQHPVTLPHVVSGSLLWFSHDGSLPLLRFSQGPCERIHFTRLPLSPQIPATAKKDAGLGTCSEIQGLTAVCIFNHVFKFVSLLQPGTLWMCNYAIMPMPAQVIVIEGFFLFFSFLHASCLHKGELGTKEGEFYFSFHFQFKYEAANKVFGNGWLKDISWTTLCQKILHSGIKINIKEKLIS